MSYKDRELLELAAKAANIDCWWVENDEFYNDGMVFNNENDCLQAWDPLNDDGDAFRLAISLRLELIFDNYMDTLTIGGEDGYVEEIKLHLDEDSSELIRRAIVVVSAMIGKRYL